MRNRSPPELVETLLDTCQLEASDPRDHIYAILGLTNTPSRSVDVQDNHQATGDFVRIDYSTPIAELFTSLTMYILRRDKNLSVIECFAANAWHRSRVGFPSWVVNWEDIAVKERRFTTEIQSRKETYMQLQSARIPSSSAQPWLARFFYDNRNAQETKRLRLQGLVENNFRSLIEPISTDHEKEPGSSLKMMQNGDIVVSFVVAEKRCILRPASGWEYQIVGFLQTDQTESLLAESAFWDKFELQHWERKNAEKLREFIII